MLFSFVIATAQTKDELQKKKQKTEEDLRLTNQLLQQTEKTKSAGLNKLLIIKKRISLREKLINEISQQINMLDNEIEQNTERIIKLENELKQLKQEYAKMIYFAYKNRNNYDRLMFILASEDFNQAYRRMKYFQQYTKYRKKQAEKILITQKNLEYETEQLKEQRNEKIMLLSSKEREKAHLSSEKVKENQEVARLKRKEQELRNKIRENQRVMKQLENAIAELIAREAKENKTYKTLSAEEELISQQFKSNRGRLIWPIDNGVIIREFGEHPHPVIKGVKIKNDGIDIGTNKDAKVKAVFEGEVKNVIAVPGANMAVIIRHGHYLTLYSNIVNVRVKPGDKVTKGYYIGDVYYTDNDEGSVLHLRVYEETKVLNPKNWLSGM
ncbi:MAG: peptidoglycan DD-metalloendopeptidase family protein [Bacteroidetes bacterium]|nr:peptidoglycan DD-metalloendopeptidase family protein [Bacteroidota bacterium]